MKMFALALLLLSSGAFAKNKNLMTCSLDRAGGFLRMDETGMIELTYGYTQARVVCSPYLESTLENKQSFRCAGLWNFNFRVEEGQISGERVDITFKHDGEKYKAYTQASSVNYNIRLIMDCK